MSLNAWKRASDERYGRWEMAEAEWCEEDYYDVEDILASGTPVQSMLMPQTAKEVFLYAQHPIPPMIPARGIKVTANVWLLKSLFFAQIVPPASYNIVTEQALKAGASMLNFETDKRFFYELGLHVTALIHPNQRKPSTFLLYSIGHAALEVLLNAYTQRQRHIYKQTVDIEARPKKLSELETRLFHKGQYTERRFRSWWSGVAKDRQGYQKRWFQVS